MEGEGAEEQLGWRERERTKESGRCDVDGWISCVQVWWLCKSARRIFAEHTEADFEFSYKLGCGLGACCVIDDYIVERSYLVLTTSPHSHIKVE
jgi:hypothetical protein